MSGFSWKLYKMEDEASDWLQKTSSIHSAQVCPDRYQLQVGLLAADWLEDLLQRAQPSHWLTKKQLQL